MPGQLARRASSSCRASPVVGVVAAERLACSEAGPHAGKPAMLSPAACAILRTSASCFRTQPSRVCSPAQCPLPYPHRAPVTGVEVRQLLPKARASPRLHRSGRPRTARRLAPRRWRPPSAPPSPRRHPRPWRTAASWRTPSPPPHDRTAGVPGVKSLGQAGGTQPRRPSTSSPRLSRPEILVAAGGAEATADRLRTAKRVLGGQHVCVCACEYPRTSSMCHVQARRSNKVQSWKEDVV